MAPSKAAKSPQKRKRNSNYATPNKRSRRASAPNSREPTDTAPQRHQEDNPDSSQDWEARRILDEKGRKYLIEWEDNPDTGETYTPTWEKKSGVSDGLVADWEAEKAARKEDKRRAKSKAPRGTKSRPAVPPSTPKRTPARRQVQAAQTAQDSSPYSQSSPFVEESPNSTSGSESYLPSTQEVTASASTQPVSTAQESSGLVAVVSTPQEASSGESGKISEARETDGTSTFLPSSSSRPTAETADPSQPVATEDSQETEIPDSHSQEEHSHPLEIPESPTQEEPPSLDHRATPRPPRPVFSWRSFLKPDPLEDISTQESSGVDLGNQSLQEPSVIESERVHPREESTEPAAVEKVNHAEPLVSDQQVVSPTEEQHPPEIKRHSPPHSPERSPQGEDLIQQSLLVLHSQETETPSATVAPGLSQQSVLEPGVQREGHPQDQSQDSSVQRRDFAHTLEVNSTATSTTVTDKSSGRNSGRFGAQEEQNAQVLFSSSYVSTQQDNSAADVRLTTESGETTDIEECDAATPKSRHDSSQESPVSLRGEPHSSSETTSQIPLPPPYSLDALDSIAPPRPQTPTPVSASSPSANMSDEHDQVYLDMFGPDKPRKKRVLKQPQRMSIPSGTAASSSAMPATPAAVNTTPAAITPTPAAAAEVDTTPTAAVTPAAVYRNPGTPARELSAPTETRSPSTIPDRPPENADPPSLRTEALLNSAAVHASDASLLMPQHVVADHNPQPSSHEDNSVPDIMPHAYNRYNEAPSELDSPERSSHGNHTSRETPGEHDGPGPHHAWELSSEPDSQPSDGEQSMLDDDVSVLDEDIFLTAGEYIVPLAIHHHQKAMYNDEVKRKEQDIIDFLGGSGEQTEEMVQLIQKLKDVESHIDLVYLESRNKDLSSKDQQRWDRDENTKFRFLHALLSALRSHVMHVMIVLNNDDERIFGILQRFLEGESFYYKYPAKTRHTDYSKVKGEVKVTILAADSSFVMNPPDVIICLDGGISATELRRKKWANNPDRPVPILELVIPRSVSHIELCMSSTLDESTRLHTIIRSLAQLHGGGGYIGQPLVDTPGPTETGELVAKYLLDLKEPGVETPEWPLPSIHSIKGVVELVEESSQIAQEKFQAQGGTPAPASTKRPLDDDAMDIDQVKRMRMSPGAEKAQHAADPEIADITHVSDSMPGTAVQKSKQLENTVERLQREIALLKEKDRRHREEKRDWDRRQTAYEDTASQLRIAQGELQSATQRLEKSEKDKEVLRQRLQTAVTEKNDMKKSLDEYKGIALASPDQKTADNARLLNELSDAITAKESAIKAHKASESLTEYMKDQLRQAQSQATSWKSEVDTLTARNANLEKLASGQVTAAKQIHYDASFDALQKQVENLKIENANKDRLIERRDEEIQKLKGDKRGYGTRQSSVPRSPRVGGPGSRAGSPLPARDRVSNLRKE